MKQKLVFCRFFFHFGGLIFLFENNVYFGVFFLARSVGIIFVPYFWMLSDVFSWLYNRIFTLPNLLSLNKIEMSFLSI